MKEVTTDNIYAYALSKTLTKVSSPATVGLYSSCQDRLYVILDQIGVYTNRESLRIEEKSEKGQKPRAVKHSVKDFLVLIVRLLFYTPVWTTENQNHHNVRFLYVNFSAWHFAGSDMLWAGIAIRLFSAMQMNFGKLQLALYRVTQYDEEDELKEKEVKDSINNWAYKIILGYPLWFVFVGIIVVPVVLLVVFFVLGFPEIQSPEGQGTEHTEVELLEGAVFICLGIPAATGLRFVFQMVNSLAFSQAHNIKKGMDNERISKRLGFMNEVRKEMWFLTQFIKFMEVFERRRIRIVLKITHLDRCSPKKIVAVLGAINILLSDEESPVLSILAANPNVLLEKVKFAENSICKEDRAHGLLNRIVTLAFTVPTMSENLKRKLFHSLNNTPGFSEDCPLRWNRHRRKTSVIEPIVVAIGESTESFSDTLEMKEDELEKMVQTILSNGEKKLNKYMLDDAISMKRTISSVWVTVIIMKLLKKEFPDPEHTAAWVVLANQWPCRFSWILQCVEDEKQRAAIDQQNMSSDDSKTLWEVFSESREELYVMRTHIEDLLEQDGDPEVFEALLKDDEFEFTLKNLEIFQMERMKLDSTYRETVKKHKLNGSALVFGDTEDLKALLGMTFGEWATFKQHFLSFVSPLRPPDENMLPLPAKIHLSKLLRCVVKK
ncbi:NTPase KAP family P-loop domain-containing protein 1-like isoform X2 [Xiphophorus maculatus]|uniref:NTPase KAP family P-loop domain-containing protein 1-like isoform X2 n=1 Tax=Xiphophorus maculatus TaxID=8083 RepID=UPI000C6D2004|nr:NTPase KAP family P-loop domain-containing protein 1-like isoform X2 [Xiphophorus maculatus]